MIANSEYLLVMEWANNGNLDEYLANNFETLQWQDKIRLAKGIAEGIKCLHDKEIFHRDLVSNRNFIIGI